MLVQTCRTEAARRTIWRPLHQPCKPCQSACEPIAAVGLGERSMWAAPRTYESPIEARASVHVANHGCGGTGAPLKQSVSRLLRASGVMVAGHARPTNSPAEGGPGRLAPAAVWCSDALARIRRYLDEKRRSEAERCVDGTQPNRSGHAKQILASGTNGCQNPMVKSEPRVTFTASGEEKARLPRDRKAHFLQSGRPRNDIFYHYHVTVAVNLWSSSRRKAFFALASVRYFEVQ